MNDQRVKTDNDSAIAEFMGWERYSQNSFKCPNTYPIHNNTSNGWTTFSADQLEFGSRWDWLMPVVEKIDRLNFRTSIAWKGHDSKDANIVVIAERDYTMIVDVSHGSKIEAVYKAVVEFIHWYNENKKTS